MAHSVGYYAIICWDWETNRVGDTSQIIRRQRRKSVIPVHVVVWTMIILL